MSVAFSTWGIGTIARYTGFEQIGEGAYGFVFKAQDKLTDQTVAIKKLVIHKESVGFPLTFIREVKFLKSLRHKNIVQLKDVITSKGCQHLENDIKYDSLQIQHEANPIQTSFLTPTLKRCGNVFYVFEYIENDLSGLMDAKVPLTNDMKKYIIKQILEALDYLHEKKIMHRDIKPSNILITNKLEVKLADFGLARSTYVSEILETKIILSTNVVTLWYRPPELLLGFKSYFHNVDIWSVGCILGELHLGRPLFPGRSETEQLEFIVRTLGIPTEEMLPGISALPIYSELNTMKGCFQCTSRTPVEDAFKHKITDLETLNFLERMLAMSPHQRFTARNALTNRYFLSERKNIAVVGNIHSTSTGITSNTTSSSSNISSCNNNSTDTESAYYIDIAYSCHEFETKKRKRAATAVSLTATTTTTTTTTTTNTTKVHL